MYSFYALQLPGFTGQDVELLLTAAYGVTGMQQSANYALLVVNFVCSLHSAVQTLYEMRLRRRPRGT